MMGPEAKKQFLLVKSVEEVDREGVVIPLDERGFPDSELGEDELLQVNEALEALAQAEPRLAKVVEMRYFGGYTEQEIADALALTERTVRRDWEKARLLLGAMLKA